MLRLLKHVATKLLHAVPVMLVVATVAFLLLYLAPGDPAAMMAGENATAQHIAEIQKNLGLDQPVHIRFGIWMWSLLTGDLGSSLFSGKPVTTLIGQRLEPTIILAAMTIVIAIAIALPLGVIAGWQAGTWIDRVVMGVSVLGFSVPNFIFGYVLIYVFASKLQWLPVQGYRDLSNGVWPALRSLILPSITLAVAYLALIARITRASMVEVLSEDYVRTARAKGLSQPRILVRHALTNASIPIVTVIGIGIAALISGVVIAETVFNIPGLGRLLVDAIVSRDYPVIQAMLVVFSGVYVLINVLIDILYGFLDPRIRY
jgi:peptide/nickel transport system permease protein